MTDPFLFIVGYPRSGTTLLRGMFDSHHLMAVPDESHFIPIMATRRRRYEGRAGFRTDLFLSDLLERHQRRSWWVPADELRDGLSARPPRDLADALRRVYRCYAASRGKPRYGDKTPAYVLNIARLARLFPESRFIHIIRDGRDVALSILDRPWGPSTMEEAAFRWRQAIRRGRSEGGRLGEDRYREVRYEDLVRDAEGVLRPLCAFADLEFDPSMERFHENQELISERAWFRPVSLPPTPGLRDWRKGMSQEHVVTFESLAGGTLREFGYELSELPRGPVASSRAWWSWSAVQLRRPVRRIRRLRSVSSAPPLAERDGGGVERDSNYNRAR